MKILLNGEAREIPDDCTVARLIELLGLTGKRLAVEVNRDIVPRSQYEQHGLHADDRVEVVHAIGGGQPLPRPHLV